MGLVELDVLTEALDRLSQCETSAYAGAESIEISIGRGPGLTPSSPKPPPTSRHKETGCPTAPATPPPGWPSSAGSRNRKPNGWSAGDASSDIWPSPTRPGRTDRSA